VQGSCSASTRELRSGCEAGPRYSWPKPTRCPKCQGLRLWGHGYVERYFDSIAVAIWLKRFRCPQCNAVHTCCPKGYLRSIRYPAFLVALCLAQKILHGRWIRCLCRQVQQYWYRTLRYLCSTLQSIRAPSIEHLDQFLSDRSGIAECDRAIVAKRPYLIFASKSNSTLR